MSAELPRNAVARSVRWRAVATGRLIAVVAIVAAVSLGASRPARADGDPASDVLLGTNVFYPYAEQPVSPVLQKALAAETVAAGRAHVPVKIALIASPVDLGAVADLFGHPQTYANFLDLEISFTTRQRLLVVMPSGYGVQGLPRAARSLALALQTPAGSTPDDLIRAAILALPKLAAAAGHPIQTTLPPVAAPVARVPRPNPHHSSAILILAGLGAGGLASCAGAFLAVRRHFRRERLSPCALTD